jgi:2-polyprenyl-6-methoxyphenol hydroxylase-like FAD-dependent oxidoreductase
LARTALIVGAGIGGLSAAIALRQAGWRVRVFERATSARELGFGLALAPNAVQALRSLGVADVVLSRGFPATSGELRRMDGTLLKRAQLPPNALGGPFTVALRPALHGALLDAVGGDTLALGHEATGFTIAGSRVTLHGANAPDAEGDLLVGADGIGSVIRRALHPSEPPPRPCGIVAVRGAVHGAVAHLNGLSAVYYLGPGVESVFVRASETGIYWFLSMARELVPADLTAPSAIVAHMAPRFDDTFRAVTAATDDMRVDALVDRDPLPFWGRGVVTLLGDAAHPVLPHTGQGAAQAMVDAVALGRALPADADLEPALRAHEDERRRKTAALLTRGRRVARTMRMTSPVGCALRELVIRMMPIATFAKLTIGISRRAGTNVTNQRGGRL